MSAQRRGQVGAGNRTDKIRTYNFKENRVTDHRINLTLYKLDQVLAGDLDELTDALDGRQAGAPARGRGGRATVTPAAEPGAAGRLRRRRRGHRCAGRRAGRAWWVARARGPLHRRRGARRRPGARPRRPSDGSFAPARRRRPGPWRPAGRRGSRCSTSSDTGPSARSTSVVDSSCLIPRPETEQVVEVALGEARRLRRAAVATPARAWWRSTPGRGAAPSRWPWPPSSAPGVVAQIWATDPAPMPSRWRRPTCDARRRSGVGGLPEGRAGRGELAGRRCPAAARPRRPGGVEPALRDRGGVGRAGPRGAGRAPAGPGRRRRAGAGRRAGRRGGRARAGRAWLGRPGAVVVELAPPQAGAAQRRARSHWGTTRCGSSRTWRGGRGRWWHARPAAE